MVGAGFLLAGLALFALFMVMGDMTLESPRTMRVYIWAIVLPYLANTTGWIMTELGRTPWVVYGLIKLEDSLSTVVTGGHVLTSLIGFTLIYGALMVATIYLLAKYAKVVQDTGEASPDVEQEFTPSLIGAED